MSVYVSTSCLAGTSDLFNVLKTYAGAGFKNIELGSRHKYISNLSPDMFGRYDLRLLCHNYFPPPRHSFIINLASTDPAILAKSREQIKRSIDFCSEVGIGLFSFHAGFRADPDNTLNFRGRKVAPYERAFAIFVESINEISNYAEARALSVAVENSVLAPYNMVDGQNAYLLMCQAEEFARLFAEVPSPNLGMLLDTGHLNVTARSLGFDRNEFIRRVGDRVFALHAHDNNGEIDEHLPLGEGSWCLDVLKDFTGLPLVIEVFKQPIEQILWQLELLENTLRE